jgi:hypothetical protein
MIQIPTANVGLVDSESSSINVLCMLNHHYPLKF